MVKIVGVGDNTVDTYLFSRKKFPGGNALNVAVLAMRYGASSAYLGALGDDENGKLIQKALVAEGLDFSHCKMLKGIANACAEVDLQDGERIFGHSSSGASGMLQLDDSDLRYFNDFDVVHTSIYSHLDEQIDAIRANSKILSYDFSDHLDQIPRIKEILPKVDVGIISISGITISPVQLLDEIKPKTSQVMIMTQGRKGSWVHHQNHLFHQEPVRMDIVDSMGAGDAFIAAFLVNFFSSGNLEKAIQGAAEKAAQNCLHEGAFGHAESF